MSVPHPPPHRQARGLLQRIVAPGLLILAALLLGSAPASVPAPSPAGHGSVHAGHGHEMSAAEMERSIAEWFAAHPARGEHALATAVDTFLAGDFYFDTDGNLATQIDTVRIEQGETILWRWVAGTHTTTNGRDLGDPNAGLLWNRQLRQADSVFSYQFDSAGVFPFFCQPHVFFEMKGVVIVSGPGGADLVPPNVTLWAPDGFDVLPAHQPTEVQWTATDDVGVAGVDLFYRDAEGRPWVTLARDLPNTGSFTWFVHHTPTATARALVVARDLAGNVGADSSEGTFTIEPLAGGRVATTLRDFIQPGTQPLDGGTFVQSEVCLACHGGYDAATEPGSWKGTMMSQSARDPLFYACLAVAEQDAPSSGDLCIRCHAATGWLSGRSVPTDGSRLTPEDRDGVSCAFCHRLVDPLYQPGVSPPADQGILGGLLPAHRPTAYANGQYVVDPNSDMRRGPFTYTAAPHPFMESDFHRRSELCATCHDVSNPVFVRSGPHDYVPGPLDQPADSLSAAWLMPIERTFSEWRASEYPAGVYAPEFAGSKPYGIVSTCQDCHEPDVVGRGCNPDSFPSAPLRTNLPSHDMSGGNAWMPMALLGLAALYPGELDATAQAAAAARATAMLQKAAALDVSAHNAGDSTWARVIVTNRTGHKLPTGYPEGRRMWLEVRARDADGNVVYQSGAYDAASGTLTEDPEAVIYEAHLGLSPAWAAQLGLPAGPSFHFVLNDTVYKDNRIPPRGFTNAAFEVFGGAPVDPGRPAPRYQNGQHWDDATFMLPPSARSVAVTLRYQSTSKEYVEFLRDENHTNDAGQRLYDLWSAYGRSEPVVMAYDSIALTPGPSPPPTTTPTGLRVLANPFGDVLRLELTLAAPAPVRLELFDASGRRVWSRDYGVLGAGPHLLTWNGDGRRGADAGAGPFWARVRAGPRTMSEKVVRVR